MQYGFLYFSRMIAFQTILAIMRPKFITMFHLVNQVVNIILEVGGLESCH